MKPTSPLRLVAGAFALFLPSQLVAAPILQWRLDEGSGTSIAESVSGETSVAMITGTDSTMTWISGFAPGSTAAILSTSSFFPDNYIDAGTLRADSTYVPGSDPSFITLSDNYSISAWIKPFNHQYGNFRSIFSSSDGSSLYHRINEIGMAFSDGSGIPNSPTLAVVPNETYLVAMVVDTSGVTVGGAPNTSRISLWDGMTWTTLDSQDSASLDLRGMLIGGIMNGSPGTLFGGCMDEVTVYDHSLSQSDLDGLLKVAGNPVASTITPIERLVDGARFEVIFNEPVTGFDDVADLVITHSGTSNTAATITGSGTDYVVEITGLSGTGSFTLAANTASNIIDLDGDPLGSSVTSPAVGYPDGTPIRWANPGTGSWYEPSDWDLARIPVATDSIFVDNGGRTEFFERFEGDPITSIPLVIDRLTVGSSLGDGEAFLRPLVNAQDIVIGEGGGIGNAQFIRSGGSVSGALDIGVDGGTGSFQTRDFTVGSDIHVGVTRNGALASSGIYRNEFDPLTGSGTNRIYIGRSQAAGSAEGTLMQGNSSLVSFASVHCGVVEDSGDATGTIVNRFNTLGFGGADVFLGHNDGSGAATGALRVQRRTNSVDLIQNLHVGTSTPTSTGDTTGVLEIQSTELTASNVVLGDHQGSGSMSARIDFGIEGTSADEFGILNTDSAVLDGELNAHFFFIPPAGTTSYTLLNTTQANGITGSPSFQTTNLNPGFSVDSFGVVMDAGVEKVILEISGSPTSTLWANPATAPTAGDWFTAANWDGGVVPDGGHPVRVNNGGEADVDVANAGGNPAQAFSLEVGTDETTGSMTVTGAEVDVTTLFHVGYSSIPGSGGTSNGTLTLNGATFRQEYLDDNEDPLEVNNTLGGASLATSATNSVAILDATNSSLILADTLAFGSLADCTAPVDVEAGLFLDNSTLNLGDEGDLDSGPQETTAGGDRNLVFRMTNGSSIVGDNVRIQGPRVRVAGGVANDVMDIDILDSSITGDGLTIGEVGYALAPGAQVDYITDLNIADSQFHLEDVNLHLGLGAEATGAIATPNFTGMVARSSFHLDDDFHFANEAYGFESGAVATIRGTLDIADNSTILCDGLEMGSSIQVGDGGFVDTENTLNITDSAFHGRSDLSMGRRIRANDPGSRTRSVSTINATDSTLRADEDLEMAQDGEYADASLLECDLAINLLRSTLEVGRNAELGELTIEGPEVAGNYSRSALNLTSSWMSVGDAVTTATGASEVTIDLDRGFIDMAGSLNVQEGTTFDFNLAGPTRATAANAVAGGALYSGVDVAGAVTLSGGDLRLNVEGGPLTEPAYVLFNYGSLSGAFDNVFGIPAGYTLDYAHNGGTAIALVTGIAPPTVVSITPSTLGPLPSGETINNFTLEVVFSEQVTGFDSISDLIVTKKSLSGIVAVGPGPITTPDMTTFTVPIETVNLLVADGVATGCLEFAVSTASDITSVSTASPLVASVTSDAVVLSATAYQLWAIEQGLTPGDNFGYTQNADSDPWINGREWLRSGDPLVDDIHAKRIHFVDVVGQGHFAITVPTPVGNSYVDGGVSNPAWVGTLFGGEAGTAVGEFDLVFANGDLTYDFDGVNFGMVEVVPAVDGPLPGHPDLPALPATHVYRTFRLVAPTSVLPRGFVHEGPLHDFFGSP